MDPSWDSATQDTAPFQAKPHQLSRAPSQQGPRGLSAQSRRRGLGRPRTSGNGWGGGPGRGAREGHRRERTSFSPLPPFLSPSTPPLPWPEVATGEDEKATGRGVPFQAWGSSPPRFALKAEGELRACRNQLRNPQGAPDCPSSRPQPPRPPGPAPPAHSTFHAPRGWLLLD